MAAFLLSLIFLVLFLIRVTHADPRKDVVARSCRPARVNNSLVYEGEYWKIVTSMEEEMISNKFSHKEVGDPPVRLYVFSQCMEDLSGKECGMCFNQVKALFPQCFPATGGRVYADGCFIRAENYSFFKEVMTPDDIKRCGDSLEKGRQFEDMAKHVVNDIAKRAPNNSGYAVQNQVLSSGLAVYGMANCWKTLNPDLCSACLENAAINSLSCLPSTESRVMNAGCFLRYSDYDFANDLDEAPAAKDHILSYALYAIAVVVVCLLTIIIGFCVGRNIRRRHNHRRELQRMEANLSVLNRSLRFLQFRYSTLEKATDCFNKDHKLGRGGFGEVFKGTLQDGREIAIKRLFGSGKGRTEEVFNEMDIISRAQHKNLVRCLGCCFTKVDSFLVYEFLANRSLDRILYDPEKKKELDWPKRLGIIIGTAEGLEYLHEYCQVRIVHRDVKASNILLDLRHKPKIADFGLARFCSIDKSLINTAIAGTFGYMAPEYLAQGRLTEKVDVYSFGVLVLEIVSGVRNSEFHSTETFETLVTVAWKYFQSKTVPEIIDESMELADIEEITRVVQVGLLCTQELPNLRPTMTMVIEMLREKYVQLPVPSKPPYTEDMEDLSSSSFGSARSRRQPSCLSDLCTFHSFKKSDPE